MVGNSTEKVKLLCWKCNEEILNKNKALQCEGFCNNWFHTACCGIEDKIYKKINETHVNGVLWLCEIDRDIFKNMVNNKFGSMNDNLVEGFNRKFNEIQNSISDLRVEMKETTKNYNFKNHPSYAETLKNEKPIEKKSFSQGLIIKPKNLQSSDDTLSAVKNCINPGKLKIPISNIKNIKNGGIIIKTSNNSFNKKLEEETKKVIGDTYKIYVPRTQKPTLIIKGLVIEYDEQTLKEELLNLNAFMDNSIEFKIVHRKQFKNKWTLIIETNGSTFNKMVNRYVNIGWDSHYVKEYLNLRRCYKCQLYNHKIGECIKDLFCAKCSGNHATTNCTSNLLKCVNCVRNYRSITNHSASDHTCPIYIQGISNLKERISYND